MRVSEESRNQHHPQGQGKPASQIIAYQARTGGLRRGIEPFAEHQSKETAWNRANDSDVADIVVIHTKQQHHAQRKQRLRNQFQKRSDCDAGTEAEALRGDDETGKDKRGACRGAPEGGERSGREGREMDIEKDSDQREQRRPDDWTYKGAGEAAEDLRKGDAVARRLFVGLEKSKGEG